DLDFGPHQVRLHHPAQRRARSLLDVVDDDERAGWLVLAAEVGLGQAAQLPARTRLRGACGRTSLPTHLPAHRAGHVTAPPAHAALSGSSSTLEGVRAAKSSRSRTRAGAAAS